MLRALLESPWVVRVVALVVLAQLITSSINMPLFTCPFYNVTHLPCPGCGLSRALLTLLQGHWGTMWKLHPFAPAFALFGLELGSTLLLPDSRRRVWVQRLVQFEEHTHLHAIGLLLFAVFGLLRLLSALAGWIDF